MCLMLMIAMSMIPSNSILGCEVGMQSYQEIKGFNGNVETYDAYKPSTKAIWNIKDDGKYSLSGHTDGCDLYTLYRFCGVKKYNITVTNNSDSKVKVYTVKTVSSRQATIEPGKKKTFTYSMSNTSDTFYLKFKATGKINVSGSIKKAN